MLPRNAVIYKGDSLQHGSPMKRFRSNGEEKRSEKGSTPHWKYVLTNESNIISNINFTEPVVVDYVGLKCLMSPVPYAQKR